MSINNQREWFAALCKLQGVPATMWQIEVMAFWANQEFPDRDANGNSDLWDAGYNAFATTWESVDVQKNLLWDIGHGPGNWNTIKLASGGVIHVGVYATPEDGLKATNYTLNLSYYANIRRCLHDQTGYQAAVDDFVSWVGSRAYGQKVVDFMNSCTASKVALYTGAPEALPADPTEDIVLAMFAGSEQHDGKGNLFSRAQRLEYACGRLADIVSGAKPSLVELAGSALALAASKAPASVPDHSHEPGGVTR